MATPLTAKDPFELRVGLGEHVPEQTVQEALASSATWGSSTPTPPRLRPWTAPGARLVARNDGLPCGPPDGHNPDTWTLKNGFPISVPQAAGELRKYRQGLKTMGGGLTLSGGEPLLQHRFAAKLLAEAKAMDVHTTIEANGFFGDR